MCACRSVDGENTSKSTGHNSLVLNTASCKVYLFFRKRTVGKDAVEYYDCEREMNEELYEQYQKVEKIVCEFAAAP